MSGIWEVSRAPDQDLEHLTTSLGISPLLAQLLCNRGLAAPEDARDFLEDPAQRTLMPAPLPDLQPALARLMAAIENDEPITTFGDYDVDGVTGAALLYLYLKRLGARVDYYLPNRLTDGYGITPQAIARLAERGTRLIVTVDCGVSSFHEIALASQHGIDTIVTDHHEPPEQLPPAVAVLNPKRDPALAEWHVLPGVGVAYHLLLNLHAASGQGPPPAEFLDIVAIGTIADMVALRGPNRHMVRQGLVALQYTDRPGLRALKELAGLTPDMPLTVTHIGFRLAPRINAVGRLGDPRLAFELLVEEDPARAQAIAAELGRLNQQRQELCERTTQEALNLVDRQVDLQRERVILLAQPHWHPGVIGIVATRLMETFQRPVVLVAQENPEEGRGSARSVPEFNLHEALCRVGSLFTRFGGHGQAAGFSIPLHRLGALKEALEEQADRVLGNRPWEQVVRVEALVSFRRIGPDMLAEIDRLAPFGEANPRPVLACRDLELQSQRCSRDGAHLFLELGGAGDPRVAAVGWRLGALYPVTNRLDIAFELEIDDYYGPNRVRLKLVAVRPSRPDGWRVVRTGKPGAE